jgi:hypothetical protein
MKTFLSLALTLTFAALPLFAQSPSPSPTPTNAAPTASVAAAPGKPGLLHLPATTDPGARKAGELLEQMVAALGGPAYLTMQNMEQEGRTYSFDTQGRSESEGALYTRFWGWPDRERFELNLKREWATDFIGIPIPISQGGQLVVLYVGDQGYELTYQGATALEKENIEDYLRRRAHSLPWVLRKWLDQPGIAVFYEGHVLAERKQAEQVSLITAQNDAVTVAIDGITHLPIRVSFTWRDPKYLDKNEEAESYENYRPEQGIMTPLSITRYHNGLPRNQRFVLSTKYNQPLSDTLFSPKATPPPPKGKKK